VEFFFRAANIRKEPGIAWRHDHAINILRGEALVSKALGFTESRDYVLLVAPASRLYKAKVNLDRCFLAWDREVQSRRIGKRTSVDSVSASMRSATLSRMLIGIVWDSERPDRSKSHGSGRS